MAATGQGYDGCKPGSRVRRVNDDQYESYDAGASEGTCAGEVIIGWGGVVRPACAARLPAQLTLYTPRVAQYKLRDAAQNVLPARGTLRIDMIECLEVPGMTSFSHPKDTWWGAKESADADKVVKSLWRRVEKNILPNKNIAPEFPGAPGSKASWIAVKQEFVDAFNDGRVPDHFLLLGAWPEEVDDILIYPGLVKLARQQRLVLRTPRAPLARVAPPRAWCPLCWRARAGRKNRARAQLGHGFRVGPKGRGVSTRSVGWVELVGRAGLGSCALRRPRLQVTPRWSRRRRGGRRCGEEAGGGSRRGGRGYGRGGDGSWSGGGGVAAGSASGGEAWGAGGVAG